MAVSSNLSFYSTVAWQKTRATAKKVYGYKCARCGVVDRSKGALVVNHKQQVRDLPPNSPLLHSLDNLELLCRKCDAVHPVTRNGVVVRGSKAQPIGNDGLPLDGSWS